VLAQVERIAERHTLNPRQVKVPGALVDCVVVARPENHWQTFSEPCSPAFSAEIRVPANAIEAMPMSARKCRHLHPRPQALRHDHAVCGAQHARRPRHLHVPAATSARGVAEVSAVMHFTPPPTRPG
jgi:hypothetical protein